MAASVTSCAHLEEMEAVGGVLFVEELRPQTGEIYYRLPDGQHMNGAQLSGYIRQREISLLLIDDLRDIKL